MKIISFSLILLLFSTGCKQKLFFISFDNLKKQELRIYYERPGYPKLETDSAGNFKVSFDSSRIVYTSTTFKEVKDLRDVFCVKSLNACLYEETEWEEQGFSINVYSSFSSDTSQKNNYLNPFDRILIENK